MINAQAVSPGASEQRVPPELILPPGDIGQWWEHFGCGEETEGGMMLLTSV